MTMTQKILARHAGLDRAEPGRLVKAGLDLVLGNDITAPVAIREMENAGFDKVFQPDKIALVLDHFTPNKDIKAAAQCSVVRKFAKKHGIEKFYECCEGIEHVLLPETGCVAPGELIIGADSHTCTYGALGAFSTGVGSTDFAAAMATGEAWFKVPEAIKVTFSGDMHEYVSGKDVILHLIGLLGVDGARYRSLEFFNAVNLSMDDRFTIANMVIECGAKNGIFEVDKITEEYLSERVSRPYFAESAGKDASYESEIEICLDRLVPMVALPYLPSNVKPASEVTDVAVNQVVIGSCTNGRIGDLRAAATFFRGNKVARGVRCYIVPGSGQVYRRALHEGLLEIFADAGAIVTMPTCGPCLGGHMGVLDAGERCVSTTNRNFVGRMGHSASEVYLASPYVAAASALTGKVTDPSEIDPVVDINLTLDARR